MGRFYKLEDYLRDQREDFTLSFDEIEKILCFKLPNSAYQYNAYWFPSSTHTMAVAVLNCGYKMKPDLYLRQVYFYKSSNNSIVISKPVLKNSSQTVINSSIPKVDISKYVDRFVNVYQTDQNGRYMSYDHIRECFIKNRRDKLKRDLITLHLYAYLASWGMLRNSFLMQKDYLFSKPVVDVLCDSKYDSLINYNQFSDLSSETVKLIIELVNDIRNCYLGKTYFEEGSNQLKTITNVTDTLVSKIILGTIGCVVAYDRYVKIGLSSHNLSQGISIKSLYELNAFAKANETEIINQLEKLNVFYTPMKVIDMYFFEKGFEIELAKNKDDLFNE